MDQKIMETVIALDIGMSVLLASINKADPAIGGRLLEAFLSIAEEIDQNMPEVADKVRSWTAELRGADASH